MPECRDLQTGNLGYYEWIAVPTVKDVSRGAEQVLMMAVVLSIVLSAALTFGLFQILAAVRRRSGGQ